MKHPRARHEEPKKKVKLLEFRAHEYLTRRAVYVQKSLDRRFGAEKIGGRA